MSKDIFNYKGKISIRLSNDNSEIKLTNTGTKHLGITLCKALAGYNIIGNIPKFLALERYNSKDSKWENLLNNKIPFTGITYNTSTEKNNLLSNLRLNSVILYGDMKESVEDTDSIRLAMYDITSNLLAYAKVTDDSSQSLAQMFSEIVPGVDCIITWNMEFYIGNEDISNDTSSGDIGSSENSSTDTSDTEICIQSIGRAHIQLKDNHIILGYKDNTGKTETEAEYQYIIKKYDINEPIKKPDENDWEYKTGYYELLYNEDEDNEDNEDKTATYYYVLQRQKSSKIINTILILQLPPKQTN